MQLRNLVYGYISLTFLHIVYHVVCMYVYVSTALCLCSALIHYGMSAELINALDFRFYLIFFMYSVLIP